MNRRETYQYGILAVESRKRGPAVWVYRIFENLNGRRARRKHIVGTTERYPLRSDAERACEHLRLEVNRKLEQPRVTVEGLANRYIEQVLQICIDIPIGGSQDEAAPKSF